ncbi:MAG TPA: carboxylesterase family protein [Polyangiales bacterium]|nr:carboxylesterase family protein [Polyangiales bacterium]
MWLALGCGVFCGCASDDDDTATDEPEDTGKPKGESSGPVTASETPLTNMLKTASGPIIGEVTENNGKQVLFFRGIPYAQPPTGDLRWKAPEPVKAWTTPRQATEWGNRCPQGESTLSSPGPMSEDCLYLNVLTPAKKSSERLPVMVFFHGGGLTVGTGNSPTYCHTALPAEGVVVVTVNSRLGAFGYFSHPALAKESDKNSSGNYGTLDLIESLRWVKKNAAAFGGDPENVTIFGESGGGSKVLSCMASPLAKGLFQRAIIESGSRSSQPMGTTPRETAEAGGVRVATKLGVTEGSDTLAQLRAKSWEDVQAASVATDVMFTANLSIDGWVLPQSVNEAFAQGKQIDVPLIVGANEGEVGEFTKSIPELAASMKNVKSKAYVYNFNHLPAGWRDPGCYAFHGLELAYVFGHMEGVNGATMIYLGERAGCSPRKDPQVSDEDRMVAKNTMTIWKQFAKTGNPSVEGLVDWPAYTAENDAYLAIGAKLEAKTGVATSGKMPGPNVALNGMATTP